MSNISVNGLEYFYRGDASVVFQFCKYIKFHMRPNTADIYGWLMLINIHISSPFSRGMAYDVLNIFSHVRRICPI